jgi:uncharacterized protein
MGRISRCAALITFLVGTLMLVGCPASQSVRPIDDSAVEVEGMDPVEDLYVVDCLLPGEVRRMGQMTYLSPRIPIRTTALNCRIRGGEYTAYSRADYRSALAVWLDRANGGDAEAQYMVGSIYEKGLGIDPDYAAAASWYHKAAAQNHSRSMINLAYLYEQGMGVEANMASALNWYRRAAGADENDLVFAAAARERLDAVTAELTEALEAAQREKRVLATQVERLRSDLADQAERATGATETIATMERLLAQASERVDTTEQRLTRLRGSAMELPAVDMETIRQPVREVGRFQFGRYYALVIGLQRYHHWDSLQSPHQDVRRLADILHQQYGFDTTILLDASTREILSSINDLRERVTDQDNVLIYFAGHGQLLRPDQEELRRGYWLPVNAELDRTTYWVPNSAINDHLALIDARSVLIIADSCYGGSMSTDPASILLGGSGPLSDQLVELGLSRPARYVLSSGGLHPVLDRGGGEHSVFARALIEVLESNQSLMREQELYDLVAKRTRSMSAEVDFEQRPELRPIRPAGHGAGSFFFVPRT